MSKAKDTALPPRCTLHHPSGVSVTFPILRDKPSHGVGHQSFLVLAGLTDVEANRLCKRPEEWSLYKLLENMPEGHLAQLYALLMIPDHLSDDDDSTLRRVAAAFRHMRKLGVKGSRAMLLYHLYNRNRQRNGSWFKDQIRETLD